MKGRMSQKWGKAQQVHCSEKQKALKTEKEKQEAKHNTGELFQTRLIVETFRMFETLWEAQNQDFHKNTTGQNDKSLKEQQMTKKVHSLCKESRQLAMEDKKMFPENMKDTLQKRPKQMEKWTIKAGQVTQTAFEEDERTDNNPITQCFNLLSAPGPPNGDHG